MTRRDELDEQLEKLDSNEELDELDNRAFERLFASLDDVRAPNELKASTLAAIFAQLDEDGDEAPTTGEDANVPEATLPAEKTVERPPLSLVSNNPRVSGAGAGRRARRSRHERSTARPRRQGMRLRVAAALLVVLLGIGGGASYALPANHVIVSMDDTTFDLGVNVYGATVSASATTEDGKAVLDAAGISNLNYADALDRLMEGYEARHSEPPADVSVSVRERFGGQGPRITREAERMVEHWVGAAESAPSQVSAAPSGGSGDATPSPSQPVASAPAAPAQPDILSPTQPDAPSSAAAGPAEGEPAQPSEQPAAPAQAEPVDQSEPAQSSAQPAAPPQAEPASGGESPQTEDRLSQKTPDQMAGEPAAGRPNASEPPERGSDGQRDAHPTAG